MPTLVEPDIAPAAGHDRLDAPPRPVGEHQRRSGALEHVVHGRLVPGRIPELERRPDPRRQPVDELAQQTEIGTEPGRQLEQDRAELLAQRSGPRPEQLDRVARIPQPPDVRDVPARLQRDQEPLGRLLAPRCEGSCCDARRGLLES